MLSPDIVRIHLDHARQKLGISSRTELAALALSRRYGAMSILAAAILAALEDTVDASHTAIESFTVMAANGSAEVVTIKISRKKQYQVAPQQRAASKDRGGAGAATGTSRPTGKLVDPGGEMAAGSFAQAALNAPRPSSSSYSIFMIAAFGALIYELDRTAHAAQAFDFGDGLADVFTSSPASDAKGLAAVAAPSFANFDGKHQLLQCTMRRSHSSSPKAIRSPETTASFMLAMPTRRITAATERTLFPKVPEPLTLSRRPRTKPHA